MIEELLNAFNDYFFMFDDVPVFIKSALQRCDSVSDHWFCVWCGILIVLEGFFVLAERVDLVVSVRFRLFGVVSSQDIGELDNIEDFEIEFISGM